MKRKRAQQVAALQSNVIDFDPRFDRRYDAQYDPRDERRQEPKRKRVQIYPKNLSQETYLLKLNDPQKMIIFAIGPAGTGKTMLAVQHAIDQLKMGKSQRL